MLALQIFTALLDAYDRVTYQEVIPRIIRAVAAVPIAERDALLGLIHNHRLLDGVAHEMTIGAIIRAVVAVPIGERDVLLGLIRDHRLLDGVTSYPCNRVAGRAELTPTIIRAVAAVPATERAKLAYLIQHHRLLDGVTSGYARSSIIKHVAAVPATARANLLGLIQHHHLLDGIIDVNYKPEIIREVVAVPIGERDELLALITQHRLLDGVTSGYARSSIIKHVAAVPATARANLLGLIQHHHLLDGITGVASIIRTVEIISTTEAPAAILNLIRYHHLLDGITDGSERAAIIARVARIPIPQREARVARVAPEVRVPVNDQRYFERVFLILDAPADAPIPPPDALVHNAAVVPAVAGQEALALQTGHMLQAYTALATHQDTRDAVARLLPTAMQADAEFAECSRQLTFLLQRQIGFTNDEAQRFMLERACRALALLNGDPTIEHHAISSVETYRTNQIQGLPSIRQLFVLAYKLMENNPTEYVKTWLAEKYGNDSTDSAAWSQFKELFRKTKYWNIINFPTLGVALQNDAASGNQFVNALANVLDSSLIAGMQPMVFKTKLFPLLVPPYTALCIDKRMTLIEALFMIMRGHCPFGQLLNQATPNAPACAMGAHLGMLKAIMEYAELNGADGIGAALAGMEIIDCAPRIAPPVAPVAAIAPPVVVPVVAPPAPE